MEKRLLPALLLAAVAPHAAAVNKCVDSAGRVTYTSLTCEKEGLTPAGVVKERMTVLPTASTAAPAPAPKKQQAARPKGEEDTPPLPTVKPVNPLIQQLLK